MKRLGMHGSNRTVRRSYLLAAVCIGSGLGLGTYIKTQGTVPFVSRPQIYSIGLYSGPSLFELAPHAAAANPVLTAEQVGDMAADFVADPFVVQREGTWLLFFEVLNRKGYEGDIALATSRDGLHWDYVGVVLDEPFHLSYPHVFEWRGQWYMVPESNRAGAVRLYRAETFPSRWSLQGLLVQGRYVDPTVFRHAGRWWMFATETSNRVLHLFGADELEGPWTEHVQSPVVRQDARRARCAGEVLLHEGRLLRFAQDCARVYGEKVRVFEITELSPERYAEQEISADLLPRGAGRAWNASGVHQVSVMRDDENGCLVCVDGWRWKLRCGWRY